MSAAQSSGYEDAPATRMLAVFCACCARPLVDSVSVEAGVGPECRKKHGYTEAQQAADWASVAGALGPTSLPWTWTRDEEGAHEAANKIVHRIACEQQGGDVVAYTNALRHLGYVRLADRIAARLARVQIDLEGDSYVVRAPYSEQATYAFRRIAGRRWNPELKANTFPRAQRVALWGTLMALFPGETARGPNGLFTIGGA